MEMEMATKFWKWKFRAKKIRDDSTVSQVDQRRASDLMSPWVFHWDDRDVKQVRRLRPEPMRIEWFRGRREDVCRR